METTATTVSMTEEEYIEFELKSDIRHEYVNGQLIDMPGESGLNNVIAGNLLFILKLILRSTGYKIYTHDTKLRIPDDKKYYYPDLFVSAEEVYPKKFIYHSAILVAEVLSASTRSLDEFDKFLQYRKIPELQYYLLIEPVKKVVILFTKDDHNEWFREIYNGAGEVINLPALNVSFKLADLYE